MAFVTDPRNGSLRPMRLSAFEEFMLTDDRPGYRQTFLIETTFEGEIDRAAFDAGVAEACRRHPLLSSLVRPNRIWGWRWVHQPGLAPRIDWGCREQPFTFSEGEGVDLAREAGVRFHARVGANESRLIAQFHHACCDGYGAIQFLADLFTAYTRHLKPRDANPPAYQAIKPQTLLCRDNLRVHTQREMIWFRLFVRTLANYARHVLHAPATLAGPAASRRVGASLTFPGTLTRTLAPEVLRGLKKAARRFDVTVNELLARELLLTLRDWNARQGAARDTDRFSIIVPTNLRNLEHDFMPAANVIGLVAFQRAARQLNDPDELLASIREESRFYKRWRFAAAFLDSIRVVRVFPGLLRLILRRKQSAGTAIFSCLGDPSRVITARFPINAQGHPILGNLLLTDVNAAPPIRPHTHAAFTAWHFLDKLRLGVRCNPQVFTQESAKELLDLFTERVVNQTSPAAEAAVIQRVAA